MKPLETVFPKERFSEERMAYILCYPKPSNDVLTARLKELDGLGVNAIESRGSEEIRGIKILGKGCVSVVVLAHTTGRKKVALKIRRVDADRQDTSGEVRYLKIANEGCVGPKLISHSPNFMLMDYVEGLNLPKWLQVTRSKTKLRDILSFILQDCRRLDSIGLDHGELSAAHKHIIIPRRGKPIILDFESASISRRLTNVTSISQYLFIGSEIALTIQKLLGPIDKDRIIAALRKYKITPTQEAFEEILNTMRLERKR